MLYTLLRRKSMSTVSQMQHAEEKDGELTSVVLMSGRDGAQTEGHEMEHTLAT
jgi:hypothetical protein